MTALDFTAMFPLLVLAAACVVVMLAIAARRDHGLTAVLTVAGLAISFLALPLAAPFVPRQVTPLLNVDGYALFFMGLIFAASAAVVLLAYGYLKDRPGPREEFYLLVLLATLGAAVLVASDHFAAFFLGLELLSVALFALAAYPAHGRRPLEAGIKYLILSGVSTAFLLFGMALLYAELGTLRFADLGPLLGAADYRGTPLLLTGLAMVVGAIGFKLSLVPFHMWTPDVYEGAPAPVTAFLATVSKGAMFALLLRYFSETGAYHGTTLVWLVSAIAIATMLVGNLLALQQTNVKRVLAYSSIAHLGYLLVALVAGGAFAIEAVSYYLVAYFVMTLGAFGVISVLSARDQAREADRLEDYRGLFWRRPWLAGIFTVMLLSLAGVPLTVGFIGKFYLVAAGVDAALWTLVITLIAGSAIGLYYYLRIVIAMYSAPEERPEAGEAVAVPATAGAVLGALTVLLIWLGVYPQPLISLILHPAFG